MMGEQFVSEFIGSIIGAMLMIYLFSKAIEWLVLKRIGTSESSMVLTSTGCTFLLVAALWVAGLGSPVAKGPSFLFAFLLGSVFLAIIRLRKIKSR